MSAIGSDKEQHASDQSALPSIPPLYCPIAPAMHPNAKAIDDGSIAFIERHGLSSPHQRVRLEAALNGVAGRLTPHGSLERVRLLSDLLLWLFTFDDLADEGALAGRPSELLGLMMRLQTRLRREKAQVSVAAVARRADVSRTFLYDNPEARAAVARAMAEAGERRVRTLADQDDEREATWRERALNAEDALKAAHAEILAQRTRIGELLGQVRDLEAEWTEEAIQRITTENTTLKQRVRQLTADNRTLDERLKAARSNLRFQDRRIADLEARITHPGSTP